MPRRDDIGRLALTAVLGLLGGGLAAWLGLPAAWLAGSMVAVAAASLAGLPVGTPPRLRDAAFTVLGVSMGAGVTPETLALMRAWPLSLAVLALSVGTTLVAGTLYLRRVHGWDAATARYASVPGALSAVLILAAESEADLPRVVLAQSVRLFTLVAVTPSLLTLFGGDAVTAAAPRAATVGGVADVALTLAAGAAAAALLARLRVPGGVLLGAMLASALLHGADLVHGRLPLILLIPGFVATGAVIGSRFRGTSLAVMRRTLPGALAGVALALVLSAGFAVAASRLLGLPFDQVWLAYAPGGIEAMAVMALALGADAAFVGAHHVVRIVGLSLLNPLWRRPRRPAAPSD